jgi:hypothetical protein
MAAKKKNVVEAPPEKLPPIPSPNPIGKATTDVTAAIVGELIHPGDSAIAEYRPTAAALIAMRQQIADKVWDLTTTKGNDEARQTRMQLVKLRTSLEAERKRLKAPHMEAAKTIDDEAKRITAEIAAMEDPLDELIKADENRRERERQDREAAETERRRLQVLGVGNIAHLPLTHINSTADELRFVIEGLEADALESFDEEHRPHAESARTQALEHLRTNLEARIAADARTAENLQREAAIKADQERQQLDNSRQQAILHIAGWPVRAVGKKAAEIAGMIQAASSEQINESNFAERMPEAMTARASAVDQLKAMHTAAIAAEQLQAQRDEETWRQQAAEQARADMADRIAGVRAHGNGANFLSLAEAHSLLERFRGLDKVEDPELQEAIDTATMQIALAVDHKQAAETARQQQVAAEAAALQARIENATLREAVEAVLEWDAHSEECDHAGLSDELVAMCKAALANDQPKAMARKAGGK